uniref:Microtubule associated protein 1 light chain 3 alpha n=1 Tax=Suricata suricatta TaxID=37032 RepID=A0A673TEY3_SURSU
FFFSVEPFFFLLECFQLCSLGHSDNLVPFLLDTTVWVFFKSSESCSQGRGGRDTEATSEPEGSTGNHRGEHRSLFSPSGIPIKSTMDNPTTTQYANLMHNFILKARSTVREIDPQNDLTFLRIRSKKNEIMVAPDKDYFLIVIQNPTE